MPTMNDEELDLRRQRMTSFIAAWEASTDRRDPDELAEERNRTGTGALDLTRRFIAGELDGEVFRDGLASWARGKPIFGFSGPAGGMFLNQLINDGSDEGSEALVRRLVQLPGSQADAVAAMDELASFTQKLRAAGSASQVGRVLLAAELSDHRSA
jgi:hypothetical protein